MFYLIKEKTLSLFPKAFFFPTWIVSEHWAHTKRTENAPWANGEWTMNGERTRSANACTKWTICECYVNARWTIYSSVFRRLSGNKLTTCMYFYQPKYCIIWISDKWTLNEGWAEHNAQVNALWEHCKRTEHGIVELLRDCIKDYLSYIKIWITSCCILNLVLFPIN